MPTISERLRGDYENWALGSKGPRILLEAADIIDTLVDALERAKPYVDCAVHDDGGIDHCDIEYRVDFEAIDAALSKART